MPVVVLVTVTMFLTASSAPAFAQIKAQARSAPTPPWEKGILPISPESYWHAVECGKQSGQDPPCVFWDTGLCKNEDFALAMYTPYKMVAYEVWAAVRQKKDPPTPSFQQAQQTRIVCRNRKRHAGNGRPDENNFVHHRSAGAHTVPLTEAFLILDS